MKKDEYFGIVDLDDFMLEVENAVGRNDIGRQRELYAIFEADLSLLENRLYVEVEQRYPDREEYEKFMETIENLMHKDVGLTRELKAERATGFLDMITMMREASLGGWEVKSDMIPEIDKYLEKHRTSLDTRQVDYLERKRFLLKKDVLLQSADIDLD
ncbi:hypothetical protein [Deinococcus arcticus]|uniref:hypothetical protein n=1 Tax=Deinococcus arcticus TaxID=2136176 RepID=UPI0011B236E5|nr:hypothetical protein [Deinococcus arcticus]